MGAAFGYDSPCCTKRLKDIGEEGEEPPPWHPDMQERQGHALASEGKYVQPNVMPQRSAAEVAGASGDRRGSACSAAEVPAAVSRSSHGSSAGQATEFPPQRAAEAAPTGPRERAPWVTKPSGGNPQNADAAAGLPTAKVSAALPPTAATSTAVVPTAKVSAALPPTAGTSAAVVPTAKLSATLPPTAGTSAAVVPTAKVSSALPPTAGTSAAVVPTAVSTNGMKTGATNEQEAGSLPGEREAGDREAETQPSSTYRSLSNWFESPSRKAESSNSTSNQEEEMAPTLRIMRSLTNWYSGGGEAAEVAPQLPPTRTIREDVSAPTPCHYYNVSSFISEGGDFNTDSFLMVKGSQKGQQAAENMPPTPEVEGN